MSTHIIRELSKDEIARIYPFANMLNPSMGEPRFAVLIQQMLTDGYRCAGIFDDGTLIGICGFWIRTQFFSGRQVEPDNVIVLDAYRGCGMGKQLMEWVEKLAKQEGCESAFLKSYTANTTSHRFYLNAGYRIEGFGFLKELH